MLLFQINLQIRLLDLSGALDWELVGLDATSGIGGLDHEPIAAFDQEPLVALDISL